MGDNKREPGFYFVRYHGNWVIAEWWEGFHWLLTGSSDGFKDSDFELISLTKLSPSPANEVSIVEALGIIANPIMYLQIEAEKAGGALNGAIAIQISNDANWLKEIARKALNGQKI